MADWIVIVYMKIEWSVVIDLILSLQYTTPQSYYKLLCTVTVPDFIKLALYILYVKMTYIYVGATYAYGTEMNVYMYIYIYTYI